MPHCSDTVLIAVTTVDMCSPKLKPNSIASVYEMAQTSAPVSINAITLLPFMSARHAGNLLVFILVFVTSRLFIRNPRDEFVCAAVPSSSLSKRIVETVFSPYLGELF